MGGLPGVTFSTHDMLANYFLRSAHGYSADACFVVPRALSQQGIKRT